jgi:hypothetical protein
MRVQPAGIWQYPDHRSAKGFRLSTGFYATAAKGSLVGSETQYSWKTWTKAIHLLQEPLPTPTQLVVRQLLRGACGAANNICDTQAQLQQPLLFGGVKAARGEASLMDRLPKAVAGPGKK